MRSPFLRISVNKSSHNTGYDISGFVSIITFVCTLTAVGPAASQLPELPVRVAPAFAQSSNSALSAPREYVPGEILVKYREDSEIQACSAFTSMGGAVIEHLPTLGVMHTAARAAPR